MPLALVVVVALLAYIGAGALTVLAVDQFKPLLLHKDLVVMFGLGWPFTLVLLVVSWVRRAWRKRVVPLDA